MGIKKFVREDDGAGGYFYSVEVSVGETNCSLSSEYQPDQCQVNKRQTRLCSADVHETLGVGKQPRGVEIKRFEVKSTLCKDSHDSINFERAATVEDQDVIDVAKALTQQTGESFTSNIWLVTQIASVNRFQAEEGVNYAMTLRFSESNCPLSVVKDSDLNTIYGGDCIVNHTSPSK